MKLHGTAASLRCGCSLPECHAVHVSVLDIVTAMVADGLDALLPTIHHASMFILVGTVWGDDEKQSVWPQHSVGLDTTLQTLPSNRQV